MRHGATKNTHKHRKRRTEAEGSWEGEAPFERKGFRIRKEKISR